MARPEKTPGTGFNNWTRLQNLFLYGVRTVDKLPAPWMRRYRIKKTEKVMGTLLMLG
jgi:hypothetical protein